MTESRELFDTRNDPYISHGAKVSSGNGKYMSFSRNGEFEAGQDKEMVNFGTRLVANMPGLRIGWRRWYNNVLTDDLTELLADGRPTQRREELGDLDKSLWELTKSTPRDPVPKPIDPWSLYNILELSDGEENYIFATKSKGGIGAIGRLCKEYGKERRMRPGELPIVELARDSYNHKEWGKTYFPVFKIVGWTDENNPSVDDATELHIREPIKISGQREAYPTPADNAPPTTDGAPTQNAVASANVHSDRPRRAPKF